MGLFLAGSFTFAGCGSNISSDGAGHEGKHQHEGHEQNGEGHSHEEGHDHEKMKNSEGEKSACICHMKCEGSASEEAGKCPECGMDLVKRSELDEE